MGGQKKGKSGGLEGAKAALEEAVEKAVSAMQQRRDAGDKQKAVLDALCGLVGVLFATGALDYPKVPGRRLNGGTRPMRHHSVLIYEGLSEGPTADRVQWDIDIAMESGLTKLICNIIVDGDGSPVAGRDAASDMGGADVGLQKLAERLTKTRRRRGLSRHPERDRLVLLLRRLAERLKEARTAK